MQACIIPKRIIKIKAVRMLTKADIKLVKSLGDKNVRNTNSLFVAEGNKSVVDLIISKIKPQQIYALASWLNQQTPDFLSQLPFVEISQKELEQMSSLQSTREVIGVFHMPKPVFNPSELNGLILALDTIQDPGNLGTLIRLADWYGVKHILCSPQTVDCYNSKVIQSTMGSIGRVSIHYGDLADWFKTINLPIIAASMEGQASRIFDFPQDMILLLGNEGSGINPQLRAMVNKTIRIEKRGLAESLNVAVAGAILVDRYFGQFEF
ncbi:MAG: RNA methyltransferase [Bacteroidetes bacterium B1(2017)]|nr:MAG: RNA methyltransferase [Bacteroidetes bacterium B1(2017)]